MRKDWRAVQFNPQLDRNLANALCHRFRERYRFLGGHEITRFIVDDILEVVDQYRRPLSEVKKGQMVWDGVEIEQGRKPGPCLSMKDTKLKPIILTVVSEEDMKRLKEGVNPREIRKDAVERMHKEAEEQGTTLNNIELGIILKFEQSTINKLQKEREAEKGIQLPNRGKVHDLSRGVTHKGEILRLKLRNYSQPEIKRRTNHSGDAVDHYLRDYNRVKILHEKHTPQEISLATGLSISLVMEYLDLIEELEGNERKSQKNEGHGGKELCG